MNQPRSSFFSKIVCYSTPRSANVRPYKKLKTTEKQRLQGSPDMDDEHESLDYEEEDEEDQNMQCPDDQLLDDEEAIESIINRRTRDISSVDRLTSVNSSPPPPDSPMKGKRPQSEEPQSQPQLKKIRYISWNREFGPPAQNESIREDARRYIANQTIQTPIRDQFPRGHRATGSTGKPYSRSSPCPLSRHSGGVQGDQPDTRLRENFHDAHQNSRGGRSDGTDRQSLRGGHSDGTDRQSLRGGRSDGTDRQSLRGGRSDGTDRQSLRGGRSDGTDRQSLRGGRSDGTDRQSLRGGRSGGTGYQSPRGGRSGGTGYQSPRGGRSGGTDRQSWRGGRSGGTDRQSSRGRSGPPQDTTTRERRLRDGRSRSSSQDREDFIEYSFTS